MIGHSGPPCPVCGMSPEPGEYHPYAACLFYKGTSSPSKVREMLREVIGWGYVNGYKDEGGWQPLYDRASLQPPAPLFRVK